MAEQELVAPITMAIQEKACISCKQKIAHRTGTVKFTCPQCSTYEIARCSFCRKLGARYECPACRFTGPN